MSNTEERQPTAFEALRLLCGNAEWRAACSKEIQSLVTTEQGRKSVMELATTLMDAASALKAIASPPLKRGRPAKTAEEERDRRWQALEYYDLRIKGIPRSKAISIVLNERHDDDMFRHAKRHWRSNESFLRDMRKRWPKVSKALDLVTVDTEQLDTLRTEMNNRSKRKPKSARTRK